MKESNNNTIQNIYNEYEKISNISILECIERTLEVFFIYKNEFDYNKYLRTYLDLNLANITTEVEAYKHWIQFGINECRNAYIVGTTESYKGFEWESYISINSDIRGLVNEITAYEHWCTIGRYCNMKVTNITSLSKATTTDVKIDIIDSVQLFKSELINAKWVDMIRLLIDKLDWEFYIKKYNDLYKSGLDNRYDSLIHWLMHGNTEGRQSREIVIPSTSSSSSSYINEDNLPIYIINIADRIDKKVDMINQLSNIDYPNYQFFKAFDYSNPIVKEKYDYYENTFEQRKIRTTPILYNDANITKKVINCIGAVGLIYSTIELFKQIENEKHNYVIICEDDAQFHKSFKYMLKPVLLQIQNADIIYLGYNSHIPIINHKLVNDNTKIIELIPNNSELNTIYGTYGYICSSVFRRKIIELGIDWFITNNCTIDYGYNVLYRNNSVVGAIPTGEHLIIPDIFDEEGINGNRPNKGTFYTDRSINVSNYYPQISDHHTFVFIIPSYNNAQWISHNLKSIFDQTYIKWRIIYINDCSTDNTHELFINLTEQYHNKITYINNKNKYGQAYNRYCAYNLCEDNEICIMLDGDDWLYSKYVLSYLNKFMCVYDVDMTYGSFKIYLNGKYLNFDPQGEYQPDVIERCNYRSDCWRATHLRVMKASLLKQIRPTDFLDENKEFIICSTDMVESFACLELSKGRHKLIQEILMIYNKENSMLFDETSHYSNVDKDKKSVIQKSVRNLPKYDLISSKDQIIIVDIDDVLFKNHIENYCDNLSDTSDLFLCNTNNISLFIELFDKYKDVIYM